MHQRVGRALSLGECTQQWLAADVPVEVALAREHQRRLRLIDEAQAHPHFEEPAGVVHPLRLEQWRRLECDRHTKVRLPQSAHELHHWRDLQLILEQADQPAAVGEPCADLTKHAPHVAIIDRVVGLRA